MVYCVLPYKCCGELQFVNILSADKVLCSVDTLHYILIRSNKMQQYAGIYLLQNYSTCFGCLSHPSSGVHKTVTAASGTGHITLQFDVLLMMGAMDTPNM